MSICVASYAAVHCLVLQLSMLTTHGIRTLIFLSTNHPFLPLYYQIVCSQSGFKVEKSIKGSPGNYRTLVMIAAHRDHFTHNKILQVNGSKKYQSVCLIFKLASKSFKRLVRTTSKSQQFVSQGTLAIMLVNVPSLSS